MVTLDNVLELAKQLSDEQQEMLSEILKKRLHESRRKEIARDAQESIAEFRAGNFKALTAEEAIADLRNYLDFA